MTHQTKNKNLGSVIVLILSVYNCTVHVSIINVLVLKNANVKTVSMMVNMNMNDLEQ